MSRYFYVLLALLVCHNSLWAQDNIYNFSKIDISQGLSHNQVNCIWKDEQGFMWFGTMAGLNRYDGYTIKTFRHNIHDTGSISDDYIVRIVQGPYHKLWIFTRNGWNIYDPATERFTHNVMAVLQPMNIDDAGFTDIIKDKKGNYWFLHPQRGLYAYDRATGKTIHLYQQPGNIASLQANEVSSMAVTASGDIWVIYKNGHLDKLDNRTHQVVYRTSLPANTAATQDYTLFADAQNDIWVYTNNSSKGLYYIDHATHAVLHFNKGEGKVPLSSSIIYGMAQDSKGIIWIATDHGGLNLIDKKDFTVRYLLHSDADEKSVSQNSIYSIYKDDAGIIWLGTFKKGINYVYPEHVKFPLYRHMASHPNSLPYDDVNCFVEDAQGNLWIGTNGGGLLYYNRAAGRFIQYANNPSDPGSLSNNVVVSLCIDHEQRLWVGTYYGGLNRMEGQRFIHYRHRDNEPSSIADDRIWEIKEDSQNRLWIGTLTEGLDLYDRSKNVFIHHKPGMPNSVHSGYIPVIVEDIKGNLWIGTSEGIDILNKQTGLFEHITHHDGDKNSLSNNNVITLIQDHRGWIWVGTREGLTLFDSNKKWIKTLRVEDGLPDNTITMLVEDDQHTIWLSTPNGLGTVTVTSASTTQPAFTFNSYDESDGLQGREFNEGAALKTRRGELLFGGANGFNLFNPAAITSSTVAPHLVLTDLQVFNKSIAIGKEYKGKVILPQSISLAHHISLQYDQDMFSIEFAALEYYNSEKIRYAYMLEGFNEDWLITDSKNRKATFTNLNPGKYTFKVKAVNEDGTWSGKALVLPIEILPPFWRTPVAYIIYVLLAGVLLWWGRYRIIRRTQLRFTLEQERKEIQRLHDLDLMKTRFFTNVSHEFRTPLSLIITPLDKMIGATNSASDKGQLQLVQRNARRLLNLVNQLLDFRKLETSEIKVNTTQGDIVSFIEELSYSFNDIAENKQIAFSFQSSVQHYITLFDHDKLERIVFNLLSNAFKFTPEGGDVSVRLYIEPGEMGQPWLKLHIKDTGIGIEKEKQQKIFDRFFQNDIPGTLVNQGSGIGLAITKEFVRLHGGTISVSSEPNEGSCFTVALPVSPIETAIYGENVIEQTAIAEPIEADTKIIAVPHKAKDVKKKTLLIVEDNEDFRFYLKDNLQKNYHIIEAANGKAGWQKTLSHHPDLVISDISMPEMNGIELCKKLKQDKRTSFIPVILLTAFIGEEQQLRGLETGASDYLTKPFNFEILQSKIKNQLLQQEKFKKTYQKQVAANPSAITVESVDEKFLQQALAIIEKNISNPNFSVEELSRDLFLSRVALYKKILALTGKTPIELIRSIRIKRAAQLLTISQLTIAEVAYEVGFNNPKYFAKYFKEEFGMLPSAYLPSKNGVS